MNRRDAVFSALALGATPFGAWPQGLAGPRRIGWLSEQTPKSSEISMSIVRAQLKELGQVEGRDFVIEGRWGDGKSERLAALARELIALKPAVIFAGTGLAVENLKQATSVVPIVFGNIGEPVERGFVASLARPGGNITGTTFRHEVFGKLVELVRDTLPAARRIAALEHETDPVAKRVTAHFAQAATALGTPLSIVRAQRADDLERAFAELRDLNAQALLLPPQFSPQAKLVAELAIKARLPAFGTLGWFADTGCLISLFNDTALTYARAAVLIDKILKGAKPADLAVESPERFEMVVNLKTARSLGITIPQGVLLRADRVIE